MVGGLVVADDLTGACDTGHTFAARGYQTRVLIDREATAETDVLVVDTDSRYDPPEKAAESIRAAIDAHPTAVVYKKIDSTLRGNLTAEIDAALAAVEAATNDAGQAIVAPASPATGRTTACGHHLVAGALVTDTDPGQDPEKGPKSAHLPSLLVETTYPVAHIGIGTVARGAPAVAERLRELGEEPRIVTADATHAAHLKAVAAGARRLDTPTVYAGSAGLAEHVSLPPATGVDHAEPRAGPSPPEDAHGVLGITGSVAPATLAALDAVPTDVLVSIDPAAAIKHPAVTAERASDRACRAIDREGRAVVTAADEPEAVDRALEAGATAGLTPQETRDRIAEALTAITVDIVETGQPHGVFLTGGDTASSVLDALEATAIQLTGEAVETGIPLATVEGGAVAGSALITKAGAFGSAETVVNCLDRLEAV